MVHPEWSTRTDAHHRGGRALQRAHRNPALVGELSGPARLCVCNVHTSGPACIGAVACPSSCIVAQAHTYTESPSTCRKLKLRARLPPSSTHGQVLWPIRAAAGISRVAARDLLVTKPRLPGTRRCSSVWHSDMAEEKPWNLWYW